MLLEKLLCGEVERLVPEESDLLLDDRDPSDLDLLRLASEPERDRCEPDFRCDVAFRLWGPPCRLLDLDTLLLLSRGT